MVNRGSFVGLGSRRSVNQRNNVCLPGVKHHVEHETDLNGASTLYVIFNVQVISFQTAYNVWVVCFCNSLKFFYCKATNP